MANAELYRLITEIMTGAEAAMARWPDPPVRDEFCSVQTLPDAPVEPDNPSEPIRVNLAGVNGTSAGYILVEAAIEELRDIQPRLLFVQPLEWQEINRLINAIRTLVPYLEAVPPIVYGEMRREMRREIEVGQAAIARTARQRQVRPPSERERAFLAAVDEARQGGIAVADLRTRDLWEPANRHMPAGQTISRQTVDKLLKATRRRMLAEAEPSDGSP